MDEKHTATYWVKVIENSKYTPPNLTSKQVLALAEGLADYSRRHSQTQPNPHKEIL